MGKSIYFNDVEDEFKDINPSCLGGFIQGIDWRYNVKKMLPHKRNQARRAKGHGSPKARALCHDSGEQELLLYEEEKSFPVDLSQKESTSAKKRSLKARIKALIADQSPKEGNGKKRGSKFPSRSQLQRTYSIHHLEPQDHGLGEICRDWEHPIIFFPGSNDTVATKPGNARNLNVAEKSEACSEKFNTLSSKDASKHKLEHTDVLEIFKVNKELFLEILQNADDGIRKSSRTLTPSKSKARFTKSGSFPVADLLQRRNLEPSKLKHKQTEMWSGPKGEKFPSGTLMQKDASKCTKNLFLKSGPSVDSRGSTMLARALSLIVQSAMESDEEGHGELSMPLKESKQAVQFEVIEDGSEANSSSFSVLGEVPNGNDCSTVKQDSPERCLGSAINGDGARSSCTSSETDEYEFSRSKLFHRRSVSLNESLDKYVGLFENSFGKEVKLQSSKSLRLRNENEMRSGGNVPIFFTRIQSLSHFELYSSLQNLVHGFANFADWPMTSIEETSSCTNVDCEVQLKPVGFSTSKEERVEPDDIEESGHQNAILGKSDGIPSMGNVAGSRENISGDCSARRRDLAEEIDELKFGKSSSHRKQESNDSTISPYEFPEPCPVLASETFVWNEVSSLEELQSAEGLKNKSDHSGEATLINSQNISEITSSPLLGSMPNLESIVNPDHIQDHGRSKSSNKDDADLEYVRDLLERSGFTRDAVNWKWHSSDQPLNTSIFEEMEAYWHDELEFSSEDSNNCYHHQLLFDLVNEELVHIHDRSFTYYPKTLSSSCRIRPFPKQNRIIKEICTSISTSMSVKPEQKQSSDSIVDLDLRKDDYWMNLQLDSECVALELEDIIFDELLEEVMCP